MQPSLDTVQQTLEALKLEKWKKGDIREESAANISAIVRDLKETLPPLLRDADAAPGTISRVLPASRNIDALYDVLLRIVEAARVSAPGDQVGQLAHALIDLKHARSALGDRLQEMAVAQEEQIRELRSTLQAAASLAVKPDPVAFPCVRRALVRKARKKSAPSTTIPKTPPSPATVKPNTGK
jgi:hypothetical protein